MEATEKEKVVVKFQPWVEYDDDGSGRYAEGTLIKVNEEIVSFTFPTITIEQIKKLLTSCGVDNLEIIKL